MPYRPWIYQHNRSSSVLAERGLEIGIAPGKLPPKGSSNEQHTTKVSAGIPSRMQEERSPIHRSYSNPEFHEPKPSSGVLSQNTNLTETSLVRPLLESKVYSVPDASLPQSSTPATSRSEQKIIPLTGYDHSLDRTLPQDDRNSESSSGSAYSQPGLDHEMSYTDINHAPTTTGPLQETHGANDSQISAWSYSDDENVTRVSAEPREVSQTAQRHSRFVERTTTKINDIASQAQGYSKVS